MKKVLMITSFITSMLLAVNAYSIQFEDYKWGEPEDKVMRLLDEKKIVTDEIIEYQWMNEKNISYKKIDF